MIGLSAPEGAVLAAVVPVLIVQLVSVWQQRTSARQTKATAEQLRPNGGASLRDAIDRISDDLRQTGADVRALHNRHDHLDGRITQLEDHITRPKGNHAHNLGQ